MLDAEVEEIEVKSGRATGVRLNNGETVEGRHFVASAIDAPATMHMTGEELFPDDVRDKLNGWHWGNHSLVTLHLALRDRTDLQIARVRSRHRPGLQHLFRDGRHRAS